MPTPENSPEFARLCRGSSDVDLIEILLEIAADVYPRLDREGCRREIAQLALQSQTLSGDAEHRLRKLSEYLYEVEGFRGNEEDYYDPRNSYLNDILRRRKGLPITLGILYMAIAQSSDLKLHGVAAPGHFILGCPMPEGTIYVDPFYGGEILNRESCLRRIAKIAGSVPLGDVQLEPAGNLEIVARVLRNLKLACAKKNDWQGALPVQRRLAALLPDYAGERRDLGLILLRAGCGWESLQYLEEYAQGHPQEADQLAPFLKAARRAAAEMN